MSIRFYLITRVTAFGILGGVQKQVFLYDAGDADHANCYGSKTHITTEYTEYTEI
jgi:hypothetical protein